MLLSLVLMHFLESTFASFCGARLNRGFCNGFKLNDSDFGVFFDVVDVRGMLVVTLVWTRLSNLFINFSS